MIRLSLIRCFSFVRSARRLSFVTVMLLAAACTATFVVQQYDGEPLPNERIAVLRLNGGTSVVVVAMDGEELSYSNRERDTRVHIEMLPGVHELDMATLDDPTKRVVPVTFQAEAGKVYRITIDALDQSSLARPWKPLVWEVDRETDRALRTVPLVSGATEPSPRAPDPSPLDPPPDPSPPPEPPSTLPVPPASTLPPPPEPSVAPTAGATPTDAEPAPPVPSTSP